MNDKLFISIIIIIVFLIAALIYMRLEYLSLGNKVSVKRARYFLRNNAAPAMRTPFRPKRYMWRNTVECKDKNERWIVNLADGKVTCITKSKDGFNLISDRGYII